MFFVLVFRASAHLSICGVLIYILIWTLVGCDQHYGAQRVKKRHACEMGAATRNTREYRDDFNFFPPFDFVFSETDHVSGCCCGAWL